MAEEIILDLYGFEKRVLVDRYAPQIDVAIPPNLANLLRDNVDLEDNSRVIECKKIRFVHYIDNIYRPL